MDHSFGEFFVKHYARLVRSLEIAGGGERSEDLAQESFAELLIRWSRIEGGENPPGYLYRTAFHKLTKAFKVHQDVALPEDLAIETSSSDFEELLSSDSEVMGLISKLPDRARLCVWGVWILDMEVAEVAKALKVAPGTVRKHLAYGKRTLQKELSIRPGQSLGKADSASQGQLDELRG